MQCISVSDEDGRGPSAGPAAAAPVLVSCDSVETAAELREITGAPFPNPHLAQLVIDSYPSSFDGPPLAAEDFGNVTASQLALSGVIVDRVDPHLFDRVGRGLEQLLIGVPLVEDFPFDSFEAMEELEFFEVASSQSLKRVGGGGGLRNPHLKHVVVYYNPALETIVPGSFVSLPSLQMLILSNNNISRIEDGVFNFRSLLPSLSVFLGGNRLEAIGYGSCMRGAGLFVAVSHLFKRALLMQLILCVLQSRQLCQRGLAVPGPE